MKEINFDLGTKINLNSNLEVIMNIFNVKGAIGQQQNKHYILI